MSDPRTLDALDPPPWDSAPAEATFLVERCHELRREPIDDFSVEDLRLMIGQRIGLSHLVPLALNALRADPLVAGDYFPGDLLLNVLRVERDFWKSNPKLAAQLDEVLGAIPRDAEVEQEVADRMAAFRASS